MEKKFTGCNSRGFGSMGRRKPYKYALGMVETTGNVGTIEALDAMTKAADCVLTGQERIGGGFQAIFVQGTVGAVKAAVAAGRDAADRVGEFRGAHVIPKPSPELKILLPQLQGS